MDLARAQQLMEIYHRLGLVMNEADLVIRSISDEEERKAHLQSLGCLMGDLWIGLQMPIVRQYPQLDPDKDVAE